MTRLLRPAFAAFAAACLCAPSRAETEPVELFYYVNHTLFQVDSFEDGLPKLDREADPATLGAEDLLNRSWLVRGELPLEAKFAAPLADYSVRRRALPYARRFETPQLEIEPDIIAALKKTRWRGGAKGMFVLGWIDEGELRGAFVTRSSAKSTYLATTLIVAPESSANGQLYAWLVRDGAPVERAPEPFDSLFFGEDLGPEDYQRLAKAKDGRGSTALHYAAAGGLARHIQPLLQARKNGARQRDDDGNTALYFAARCGRAEAARALLAGGASAIDGKSLTDSSLYAAATWGHLETLQALATQNPRPGKERDQYSWALASAINADHEPLARHLLDLRAPIDIAEEARGNAVLKKFVNGFPELALLLMERHKVSPTYSEEGYNFFHAAAPYADNELLDRLLALGVDLKQRSSKGALPMDVAVGLGNVEAICWFIDNGGRGEAGEGVVDPVFHAIQKGQPDSVSCLIDYGFDVNREVSAGVTPLMYAVYEGEIEIARSIARAGGVWDFDSLRMDRIMSKILERDAADLLASALDQGWPRDRLLLGDFSLRGIAEFHGASGSLEELARRDWPDDGLPMRKVSELEQTPRLKRALDVDYPAEMQERYGQREVTVEVALSSIGVAAAMRFAPAPEPELAEIVARAVEQLVFEPAVADGAPAPTLLKFKVPLEVDMSDDNVFELADVDTAPKALSMSEPQYPYALQMSRTRGRVVVEFVLDEKGVPQRLRAVTYTLEAFVAPALQCVAKSAWSPARKDGKPVSCRVRLPIEFKP